MAKGFSVSIKTRQPLKARAAQAPRLPPRRYWIQAAMKRPARVTGIRPSTMPQRRGSIIENQEVVVASLFHGQHPPAMPLKAL